MYIPDLSRSVHPSGASNLFMVAIGWLDRNHEFPKGKISKEILDKIGMLCCMRSVNKMRGFHMSPFLGGNPRDLKSFPTPAEYKGKRIGMGNAEIQVPGQGGITYSAPTLIYHYIRDCEYLPPQEFLDALNAMDFSEIEKEIEESKNLPDVD